MTNRFAAPTLGSILVWAMVVGLALLAAGVGIWALGK